MSKAKAAKPKNPDLPGIKGPGVAPISIPAIDNAAAAYVRERDKRMAESKREIAAREKLSKLLHENEDKIGKDSNGEIVYRYDDQVISLKPGKEQLKVYGAKEEN